MGLRNDWRNYRGYHENERLGKIKTVGDLLSDKLHLYRAADGAVYVGRKIKEHPKATAALVGVAALGSWLYLTSKGGGPVTPSPTGATGTGGVGTCYLESAKEYIQAGVNKACECLQGIAHPVDVKVSNLQTWLGNNFTAVGGKDALFQSPPGVSPARELLRISTDNGAAALQTASGVSGDLGRVAGCVQDRPYGWLVRKMGNVTEIFTAIKDGFGEHIIDKRWTTQGVYDAVKTALGL